MAPVFVEETPLQHKSRIDPYTLIVGTLITHFHQWTKTKKRNTGANILYKTHKHNRHLQKKITSTLHLMVFSPKVTTYSDTKNISTDTRKFKKFP